MQHSSEHDTWNTRGRLIAATLGLGAFLVNFDVTSVVVVMPAMGADLGIRVDSLAWIIDAYSIAFTATLLVAGALSDRFGRRRALIIGNAWFLLASLACGIAWNSPLFLAARAAQGGGAAFLMTGAFASIGTAFPAPGPRARAFGIVGVVSGVAMALGPSLGGIIGSGLGWRWIFLANPPLCALLAIVVPRVVAEARDYTDKPLDWLGVVYLTLALGRDRCHSGGSPFAVTHGDRLRGLCRPCHVVRRSATVAEAADARPDRFRQSPDGRCRCPAAGRFGRILGRPRLSPPFHEHCLRLDVEGSRAGAAGRDPPHAFHPSLWRPSCIPVGLAATIRIGADAIGDRRMRSRRSGAYGTDGTGDRLGPCRDDADRHGGCAVPSATLRRRDGAHPAGDQRNGISRHRNRKTNRFCDGRRYAWRPYACQPCYCGFCLALRLCRGCVIVRRAGLRSASGLCKQKTEGVSRMGNGGGSVLLGIVLPDQPLPKKPQQPAVEILLRQATILRTQPDRALLLQAAAVSLPAMTSAPPNSSRWIESLRCGVAAALMGPRPEHDR